jgi:PTH2 family peptidyl-tRNA hydrolase
MREMNFKYKQVMAVRKDLGMSPGKLAVQVAHASHSAAEKARENRSEWYKKWMNEKQKKVVVKVSSEKELNKLKKKSQKLDLPHNLITDAGLTEIEPGTSTVLGIGPAPNEEIDKVTGNLKLL